MDRPDADGDSVEVAETDARSREAGVRPHTTGQSAESDASRLSLVFGLLFGVAGLSSSSVAITLPDIATGLGVSEADSVWSISVFALFLAVATALYGRVADVVGLRAPLVVGVTLMSLGAVVAALAPTFALLLVGRVVQGLGAAAVPTLGAATITRLFSGPTRTRALGRIAGATVAVGCLGPLVGGGISALTSWRVVLALPALALLALPPIWSRLPVRGSSGDVDVRGAALVAAAAAGLVLLIQSPSAGLAVAVIGLILLLCFAPLTALHVRHRPRGFLPKDVVANPGVVCSAIASASLMAAWFAALIAVPSVLIGRGWEPWHVGLVVAPSAAVGALTPRLAAALLGRWHPAAVMVLGAVSASIAMTLAALGAWSGSAWALIASVFAVTVCFGIGQPAMVAAVGSAVGEDERGAAAGVATLIFLTGGGIGSAIVGGLAALLSLAGSLLVIAALPLLGITALLAQHYAGRDEAS